MSDALLLPDSLAIGYQAAGRTDWRTIAIEKGRTPDASRPIVGTASFWPEVKGAELQLRARSARQAGNIGLTQVTLGPAPGAVSQGM